MGKNIGIFGGTFNPIHLGHLNLAIEAIEKKPLDEVWFCPAHQNPFKLDEQPIAAHHRLEMIKRAIAHVPHCRVIEFELERQPPSYTIDTLRYLIAQERDRSDPNRFFLIIGDDSLPGFLSWHQVDEIIRLVPLIVGSRDTAPISNRHSANAKIQGALTEGLLKTRLMEISSTEIRERLAKGKCCVHLLPKEVLDYIKEHHLYLSPNVKLDYH